MNLTSVGTWSFFLVVAMLAGSLAKADEPVEQCGTFTSWQARGYGQAAGVGGCGIGECDNPTVRNSFIPGQNSPVILIRLKFNVFCDGSDCAADSATVAAQLAQLNSDFEGYGFQFIEGEPASYINNAVYRHLAGTEEDAMKSSYADNPSRQINVYVVDYQLGYAGKGTFSWDPHALGVLGGIILHEEAIGDDSMPLTNYTTLAHECGHNLGLWHTQYGVTEMGECSPCSERADGIDSDFTGDLASDTQATPTWPNCSHATGSDPCSDPPTTPWAPTQYHNFMEYGPSSCRSTFTPQQVGRMRCWTSHVLTSWVQCTDHIDCTDQDPCTEDFCENGFCQNECLVSCTTECSADLECDDSNDCTTDICVNPATCTAQCINVWAACDYHQPGAQDGCCGPNCAWDNDIDWPVALTGCETAKKSEVPLLLSSGNA